ncbi:MAG: hypothetical protein U0354_15610 [Candidatus Sericytochromatia bacterium]
MAIYIQIRKSFEADDLIEYSYIRDITKPNPEHKHGTLKIGEEIGKVVLDKITGDIECLQETQYMDFYYPRVCYMIKKAFKNGIYPDNIDYMA